MSLIDLIKPLNRIKYRITIIYTAAFFGVALLFAYFFSQAFFNYSLKEFDTKLLHEALVISQEIESNKNFTEITLENFSNININPFRDKSTFFILRSLNGEHIWGPDFKHKGKMIPLDKNALKDQNQNHFFSNFILADQKFRSISLKFGSQKTNQLILQLASSTKLLDDQRHRVFLINIIGLPLFLIVSSFISFAIAERALRPVKVISETVSSIASKNLSKRLPSFKMAEEFQELSETINNLLERLQKSFEAQEHFVANASHQLYTPLAIIKGELEVLQGKERTTEEYQKFHQSLKQELERMVDLVKNLLVISRIEAGHEESFKMRPLRLDDMLISTATRLKIKAKDKLINLKFSMAEDLDSEDLVINGERQLLSSLFENLLDNAIKYSPVESQILLTIKKEDGLVVSVQDEGPGIKQHDLQNILEKRFQRGTMTLMPGTGIGLSIAYKIAAHHKASIHYEKLQPQGSLFNVHFHKQNL
jgi:signal transduction histidine kinase